jgi:uncharacterized protein with FMN-binding domain
MSILLLLLIGCGTSGAGKFSRPVDDGNLSGEYRDGVYEGTGQGLRGPIRVRVWLEAGVIAELEILEHREDEFGGGPAMEELTERVLEYNSAGIDVISGATESSRGFLDAVEEALKQAARDRADISARMSGSYSITVTL